MHFKYCSKGLEATTRSFLFLPRNGTRGEDVDITSGCSTSSYTHFAKQTDTGYAQVLCTLKIIFCFWVPVLAAVLLSSDEVLRAPRVTAVTVCQYKRWGFMCQSQGMNTVVEGHPDCLVFSKRAPTASGPAAEKCDNVHGLKEQI